jgi:hypothetical protein
LTSKRGTATGRSKAAYAYSRNGKAAYIYSRHGKAAYIYSRHGKAAYIYSRHSKAVHCCPAAMRDITPRSGEGYHARWWCENRKNLERNPSYLRPGLNMAAINIV